MRTIQIKVYKFDELKPEIQEKVLNENREINLYDEWWEFIFENFKEELNKVGLDCKDFYFDFYRNRYIEAKDLNIIDENKLLKKAKLIKWIVLNNLRDIKTNINISVSDKGEVNIDWDTDEDLEIEYNEREEEIDELKEKLREFIQNILWDFLKRLEQEQDYLYSDEAVKEAIISNEYEFDINGEINLNTQLEVYNMKEIKLKEILTDKQIKEALIFIKKKDTKGLRAYLNTISDDLKNKGVLADYLYYYLIYAFKL